MPAKTELSTIDYQLLVLRGGAGDWDAALLSAQAWVWALLGLALRLL
jgi:hypothetical protein